MREKRLDFLNRPDVEEKATNNYSLFKFKAESKVTPRFLARVWAQNVG